VIVRVSKTLFHLKEGIMRKVNDLVFVSVIPLTIDLSKLVFSFKAY
jgi:hypothetical protein